MKNIVLDSNDIKNKINRISFEIIEKNYDKQELVVVGLLPNGRYISEEICDIINTNSDISTSIVFFGIDSSNNKITCEDSNFNFKSFKDKSIVVIDDVMNTGSTMIYALNKILNYSPYQIQVGVLIERNYKNFPIVPDFKGLELSTSPEEHVEVKLGNSPKVLII
jgi:pyrimidine operon attenuation protein/uracil phosphoribosyltransferase